MVRDILSLCSTCIINVTKRSDHTHAAYDCFHGWLLVNLAIFFVLVFHFPTLSSNWLLVQSTWLAGAVEVLRIYCLKGPDTSTHTSHPPIHLSTSFYSTARPSKSSGSIRILRLKRLNQREYRTHRWIWEFVLYIK